MKILQRAFFYLIIILLFVFTGILTYHSLEPNAYDFMIRNVLNYKLPFDTNKNIHGHDDIVLVVIDHKSIEKYRWPWKRDLNCKVLEYFIKYANPKAFVHDGILTALDKDAPDSDKKYFSTLKKMDNLVEGFMYNGFNYYDDEKIGEQYDDIFNNKYRIKNAKVNVFLYPIYNSIITSPQEFLDSVENIGSISIICGYINGRLSDETYRTHSYFTNYKNALLPSLAMSSFLAANDYPEINIDSKYISFPELNYKIKHKISKYTYQSIVPIKYYKIINGYSHKYYSAVDIMDSYNLLEQGKEPIVNPADFKNKIVIFGVNDPLKDGLNDNKPSPMSVNHPGMDIQATCIDNLFHNDFLNVLPGWVNIIEIILGILLIYYAIRFNNLFKAILSIISIIFFIILISILCFYNGIVINVITPIIMCIITMIVAYIHKYVLEAWTKQKVQYAMGKYMSEDVMKNVLKNIDNLGLGGQKSVVTVLFSDIRGFTSLSEQMTAQEVSTLFNEYFSAMEPIVRKYNGIINKFIGDAVMAVFGEPISDDNHPINAVKCGFEMLNKVKELDIYNLNSKLA